MRIAYLGPEGTFSHEALLASGAVGDGDELLSCASVYEAIGAVHEGAADRALCPTENALEGAVNATLDALVFETDDVRIVGETVHPIRVCLVAATELELGAIDAVRSHPQPLGQCARFISTRLPGARVVPVASTAEAVRGVLAAARAPAPPGAPASPSAPAPPSAPASPSAPAPPSAPASPSVPASREAALAPRAAADLYGATVLLTDVEDVPGNETRFVWLAREDAAPAAGPGPWKTSLVFWDVAADSPGWLVRCLSEFAFRGVNLVRIESRPRKQGLGRYMFFLDLEGHDTDPAVGAAIEGLRANSEVVRVLGSYPAV